MLAEHGACVAAKGEVAEGLLAAALLLPDEEQRGPRPVLPAQHRAAAQAAEVEVRVAEAHRVRRGVAVGVEHVRAVAAGAPPHWREPVGAEGRLLQRARASELLEAAVLAA